MSNLNREQQLEQLEQDLKNFGDVDTTDYLKAVDDEYLLLKKSPLNTSIFGAIAGMLIFIAMVFLLPLHGFILLPLFFALVIGFGFISKMVIAGNVQRYGQLLSQARVNRENEEKSLSLVLEQKSVVLLEYLDTFEQHLKNTVSNDDFESFLDDIKESRETFTHPDVNDINSSVHEQRVDAYLELVEMVEFYVGDATEDYEEESEDDEENGNNLNTVEEELIIENTRLSPTAMSETQKENVMAVSLPAPVKDAMQVDHSLFDVKK